MILNFDYFLNMSSQFNQKIIGVTAKGFFLKLLVAKELNLINMS